MKNFIQNSNKNVSSKDLKDKFHFRWEKCSIAQKYVTKCLNPHETIEFYRKSPIPN